MNYLALDIDGTLTHDVNSIPKVVIDYLAGINHFKIIILTGRSYPFVLPAIKKIDFSYVLSTQNGSSAWNMPKNEIIFKDYLARLDLIKVEKQVDTLNVALVSYGSDYNCYYKKKQ